MGAIVVRERAVVVHRGGEAGSGVMHASAYVGRFDCSNKGWEGVQGMKGKKGGEEGLGGGRRERKRGPERLV